MFPDSHNETHCHAHLIDIKISRFDAYGYDAEQKFVPSFDRRLRLGLRHSYFIPLRRLDFDQPFPAVFASELDSHLFTVRLVNRIVLNLVVRTNTRALNIKPFCFQALFDQAFDNRTKLLISMDASTYFTTSFEVVQEIVIGLQVLNKLIDRREIPFRRG